MKPLDEIPKSKSAKTSDETPDPLVAQLVATGHSEAISDPELARLVASWSTLDQAAKQAILDRLK